jgi:hypothetical protein
MESVDKPFWQPAISIDPTVNTLALARRVLYSLDFYFIDIVNSRSTTRIVYRA